MTLKHLISTNNPSFGLGKSLSRGIQQRKINYNTQLELFENCMRLIWLFGKYLGIFPYSHKDQKTKYTFSWRLALPLLILTIQFVCMVLCLLGIIQTSVNIGKMSQMIFYGKNTICSFLIIKLAMQWNDLMKEVASIDLHEYIDPLVKFKCNVATIAFISLTSLNSVISVLTKLAAILDCNYSNTTLFEQYTLKQYTWLFRLGVPYSLPLGALMSVLDIVSAFNYTYIQILVICISLYLSSVLQQIYKRIYSLDCKYVASSYWGKLRQDYNQATRLVRSLDDVINGIVFASFAGNLYLVCLQVFFVLRNDITIRQGFSLCPNNISSGYLNGYDDIVSYTNFIYSSVYFIVRTLLVSFITAKVHTTSLKIAPILYSVPPPTYCTEIQRFIEQVHGNTVALTGLNFFFCTKDVILSMIATVITYELVLLQFN